MWREWSTATAGRDTWNPKGLNPQRPLGFGYTDCRQGWCWHRLMASTLACQSATCSAGRLSHRLLFRPRRILPEFLRWSPGICHGFEGGQRVGAAASGQAGEIITGKNVIPAVGLMPAGNYHVRTDKSPFPPACASTAGRSENFPIHGRCSSPCRGRCMRIWITCKVTCILPHATPLPENWMIRCRCYMLTLMASTPTR